MQPGLYASSFEENQPKQWRRPVSDNPVSQDLLMIARQVAFGAVVID
jgi:hypothetical protein